LQYDIIKALGVHVARDYVQITKQN